MILYHKDTALHCPRGCCEKSIQGLDKQPTETVVRQYLLIRNPLQRAKELFTINPRGMKFKAWAISVYVSPQVELLPHPDAVIRAEHFTEDMEEYLGIHATIELIDHPEIVECLVSRVAIRKYYKLDYQAGDYE